MTWCFDSVKPLNVDRSNIIRWAASLGAPLVHLYVMGWIAYSDDLGFVRRTAFCRELNNQTERFVAIDDRDYEHAE